MNAPLANPDSLPSPVSLSNSDLVGILQRHASDAGMFGLLSRLWTKEIDLAILRSLVEGDLNQCYVDAGGHVPAAATTETVEQLAIEYCACFLGPKHHLPPHQSVVLNSKFQGECIDSMKVFVEVAGNGDVEFDQQNTLDHAGVQFKLAQLICGGFADVTDASLDSLIDLQRSYHHNHLEWIRQYCVVADRQSHSPFYSALFQLTNAFLEERFLAFTS